MVLLLADVFVLLTQVLLWIVVGLFAWYVLLRALPRALLGGLVLLLLLGVAAFTFYRGSPAPGLFGDLFRILAVPLSPFGIIVILLLIAFADLIRGKQLTAASVTFVRIAVPALFILSLPVVAYNLAQELDGEAIAQIRPAPALPAGARRVIVVLAQGTTQLQLRPRTQAAPAITAAPASRVPFVQPTAPISETAFSVLADQPIQLTERGDVLTYAAQIYRENQGAAPLLVVTAGRRDDRLERPGESRDDISEAADARRFLQSQLGVPPGDIIGDSNSPTIYDSAVNVRQELQRRGIPFGGQLILVSPAFEANRAALTFTREFNNSNVPLTVISRPTGFNTIPQADALRGRAQGRDLIERRLSIVDLLPNVDALALSSRAIGEYFASIYYFLRGWIRPIAL
jgi:hypothetical protein